MRAAQAEDSATTVMRPRSKVQRFTLTASSGPRAFITATCHSDDSEALGAPSTSFGGLPKMNSPIAVGGASGRIVCLFRRGVLGIVSRLLGLSVLLTIALGSGR